MKGLCVEGVSFRYPRAETPVLEEVSFTAGRGQITALLGANGAGKTTLLRAVLGLLPGSGRVTVDGAPREAPGSGGMRRQVGYMPQENALPASLSVLEVVLLGRLEDLRLAVRPADREAAWEMLRRLQLEHLAARPFRTLSGGQRRVVGIAQTLVREPAVLVLDEPTANLDLQNGMEVLELIRAYTRQKEAATLVTLHDLGLAARYADKLVLLQGGRVLREGPPASVITEAAIREAFGVRARVRRDEAGLPAVHPLGPARERVYRFL